MFSKKLKIVGIILNVHHKQSKAYICVSKFQNNLETEYAKKTNSLEVEDEQSDHEETTEMKLYADHIPTNCFQKSILAVGSSIGAILNPYRDDHIAVLGETTGVPAARVIRKKMLADTEGQQILREQPRINSETIDLDYLRSLPKESFGQAYIHFLESNKVSPDTRQPVHFVDDVELAYVIQRYREVHDLVHTLLGMPTNMLGEVAVKWVEAIQTGFPMCISGALIGPIRFKTNQRRNYLTTYLPWAIECGFRAKFLMNIYFEKRWHQSLAELRTELNIKEPPI